MKLRSLGIVESMLVCAAVILAGSARGWAAEGKPQAVLYACGCEAGCKCVALSTKAGKCKCDKELKAQHVLKVDGDQALMCSCGAECKCTVNEKDPAKCSCGKAVRKESLKGTGLYYCNCGSSCACNTFSDKPGKCKCGMDLKRSE